MPSRQAASTPGEPSAPRRRPGGRTARTGAAILEAALTALLEGGYDALNVRTVAQAADVAETTIYRRWPTKADLAAAALGEFAQTENPIPDTGTLQGDLRKLLAQIIELLRRPEIQRILRTLSALGDQHASAAARNRFWEARFAGSAAIVDRAISRGELPAGTDAEGLIELLVAPTYLRLLLLDRPLDEELLERSVRQVLATYPS